MRSPCTLASVLCRSAQCCDCDPQWQYRSGNTRATVRIFVSAAGAIGTAQDSIRGSTDEKSFDGSLRIPRSRAFFAFSTRNLHVAPCRLRPPKVAPYRLYYSPNYSPAGRLVGESWPIHVSDKLSEMG